MIEILCEADIQCSADKLFDVIVDFRGQERWLPSSSLFHGTTAISSNPVTLGTTYREPGPLGVRNGTVTEFARPTTITFHQPMTIRLRLGTIDVLVRYTLTPHARSTRVRRSVTLGVPWSLKVVQPLLVRATRVESCRTVRALKAYVDTVDTVDTADTLP